MIYTEMPIFIPYAGCTVSLAVCNEATVRVEVGVVDGAEIKGGVFPKTNKITTSIKHQTFTYSLKHIVCILEV